ncbi:serine hydrolase domain-containing protein [Paenibacillus sp. strain BS8-2]
MTENISRKLEQYMDNYIAKWPFSGTLLVARRGEILLREAYGQANLEHEVINRTDTKFGIWSITKSFTALAIAMLEREGKLKLDDLISTYIPEMKSMPQVTIRQAMHHVTGLPNLTSMKGYNFGLNKLPLTREEAFALLRDQPIQFHAGSRFEYNNTGYYLLGLIVESVGGVSYEQWMTERILKPLGMLNTGILTNRSLIPALASAYHASDDGSIPAPYVDMGLLFSTGGMYSSIDDLYKWALSFETGELLSREQLSGFFDEPEATYGLGWFLGQQHGRKRIHHGGAYCGFRTELHRYPEDGVTIIVLTNYDYVPVTKLADTLAGIMFGEEFSVPVLPPTFELSQEQLQSYIGTYEGFGCKAVVSQDERGIFFEWNNREILRMYPIGPDTFHHHWFQSQYAFKRNENGELKFLGMERTEH